MHQPLPLSMHIQIIPTKSGQNINVFHPRAATYPIRTDLEIFARQPQLKGLIILGKPLWESQAIDALVRESHRSRLPFIFTDNFQF